MSRKKAQVPREELNQSGCSSAGTCPTGVLLRASTAIVHVRPVACLSCHPISSNWVVMVCSCSLATFLGRPLMGPQNVATQHGARGRLQRSQAISPGAGRPPFETCQTCARQLQTRLAVGEGSRACDWTARLKVMRKAGL